jgi:cob(II)yrinic acid a,c-diamide reductase
LKTIEISPAEYRDAMARIAEQIHVVTTDGEAGRRVVAATAVTSVSDNPATILVCLNLSIAENDLYLRNGVFAVSTLGERHEALARACSGQTGAGQEERFALGGWERMATGAPVLSDAVAGFDCTVIEAVEMATHRVLFGRVKALSLGGGDRPLIYHNRRYRVL